MSPDDCHFLRLAARLALRGHGRAEPNPLVGCVIVAPGSGAGGRTRREIVGWGHHARCGGPHAEIHALRRAGELARGSTVYITFEPCNHHGRTGPCSEALIDAGVKRVVFARRDPHPSAKGGATRLREAGVETELADCPEAAAVSDPFVHRLTTGLPWITLKWAQSIDGRTATRAGESQWISGPASRVLVHRERGRACAILTGIGTVLSDDPLLTARAVRVRRTARRIVIDPHLDTPPEARLVRTAREVSTTIACDQSLLDSLRAEVLARAGVELHGSPLRDGLLDLGNVLRELTAKHDLTNVLTEAGPGLMSSLLRERLVSETWVFIAPFVMGDDHAPACLSGVVTDRLADVPRMRLIDARRRGEDIVLRYRVPPGMND